MYTYKPRVSTAFHRLVTMERKNHKTLYWMKESKSNLLNAQPIKQEAHQLVVPGETLKIVAHILHCIALVVTLR